MSDSGSTGGGRGRRSPQPGGRRGGSGGGAARGGAPRGAKPGERRSAGQPARRGGAANAPVRRPAAPAVPERDVHDPEGVRLQKVLAGAGLGSRRACEELIAEGRVTVDGIVVRELGVRVDPTKAVVHVDGERLQLDATLITIALNKPRGVVSTMHDPQGRPSLSELVADRTERLFHVGRLDADSEGLILLTNDGELAQRLAHPSYEVAKTYVAEVEGEVRPSLGGVLLRGVELEDGPVQVDRFQILQTTSRASLVEVELHEGRNRVVRRMFDEVGHPVTRLVRTKIGPVRLGDLRPGRTRVLGRVELGTLMTAVGM